MEEKDILVIQTILMLKQIQLLLVKVERLLVLLILLKYLFGLMLTVTMFYPTQILSIVIYIIF